MSLRIVGVGALITTALIAGCSTSPLTRYPDFTERKTSISSSIIIGDCTLLDALPGDTSLIDIPMNKKVAKTAIDYLAGALNEKGYHVDRTLLTSVGLVLDQRQVFRVAKTPEDEQSDPVTLDAQRPPFFVDSLFLRNDVLGKLLHIVISSLVVSAKEGKGPDPVIPGAAGLGKALGGGNLIVVLIGGYNVPVVDQIRRYTPSPSAALNKITFSRSSQCTVRLYILDSSTGELVWDDERHQQGGIVHPQKILDLASGLADRLP